MIARRLMMGLAGLLLVGCGGKSQTYEVAVSNETATPITVWLTKSGGPYERHWRSPEDLAIESPRGSRIAGVKIPSGASAATDRVKGKFDEGTGAILRIYAGDYSFSDLLAVSRGSPNRIDVPLDPGVSRFTVTRGPEGLRVKPAEDWIPRQDPAP